jgi:hypothetical protein
MKPILQATIVSLAAEERRVLEALAGCGKSEARMRIVLLAASGLGSRALSREKWVACPARRRNGGSAVPAARMRDGRILAALDPAPPTGCANWTAPLLGRELVDIHEQYILRFLRAQTIALSGRKSWCQSNDPDFVPKTVEIVGLYMAPPDNAVVLSVDEKPSVQALERPGLSEVVQWAGDDRPIA